MARTNNLTNFLNDVATAIKTKLGDSASIPAAQFDSKIMAIETPGTYQDKSITITVNGNYNLLPDAGYDALSNVRLEVNVEAAGDATSDANLQAKYLLEGYSMVADGVLITGTMPNRGTVTITATSNNITIPEGYYDSLSIPIINASNCNGYSDCNTAILSI